MPLDRLIDLIAEVAVKRTTQKGKREPETPDPVQLPYWIRGSFQPQLQALRVFFGLPFRKILAQLMPASWRYLNDACSSCTLRSFLY